VLRLDRYILREILYPAIIGLAALTFVAVSRELGRLLETIIRQSATPQQIWDVAASLLPNVLIFTLPMSVLVGILTGFGRMSSDSETVALRASGVSMRRILVPVLVLGLSAWLANTALTAWIAPKMTARLNLLKGEIVLKAGMGILQPGVFNEKFPGLTLYFRSVSPDGTEWRDIMLVDSRDPARELVIFAATGVPVFDQASQSILINLTNGNSHLIYYAKSGQYDSESFKARTISFNPDRGGLPPPAPPISQASTLSLWNGMGAGTATYEERVEFHRRFALPFACIAFAVVGLPLGVSTTRGSKSMGLVLSFILMFLYYLAFMGGTKIASDANFSPFLGAWIPNIVFLSIGIYLMSRADIQRENYVLGWISQISEWFGEKLSRLKRIEKYVTRRVHSFTHRAKLFRVIDRYVIRSFCFYFALVLVVFATLFVLVTFFELLPDIVANHVRASTVLFYFLFLMPQILFYVAPLTVLLAILISLGTLTKGNEVLAVKASGISLYRLTMPLLAVGLLISGMVYLMQDFVLPYANQRQDEYRSIIKNLTAQSHRNPDRKWMAGSDSRIYHYQAFDPSRNLFSNLSVFKFAPNSFNLQEWTFAEEAEWTNNAWELRKVAVRHMPSSAEGLSATTHLTLLTNGIDSPAYFKNDFRPASQMTYRELRKYVNELQMKQFDVTSLTLDLYRKLSFPLVSFIMAIIGIPFSFKTGKKGAFYGIGFCIALGILYWSSFELFGKLGELNRLSPVIAAWFPNLIFGLGGTWMLLRVKT